MLEAFASSGEAAAGHDDCTDLYEEPQIDQK